MLGFVSDNVNDNVRDNGLTQFGSNSNSESGGFFQSNNEYDVAGMTTHNSLSVLSAVASTLTPESFTAYIQSVELDKFMLNYIVIKGFFLTQSKIRVTVNITNKMSRQQYVVPPINSPEGFRRHMLLYPFNNFKQLPYNPLPFVLPSTVVNDSAIAISSLKPTPGGNIKCSFLFSTDNRGHLLLVNSPSLNNVVISAISDVYTWTRLRLENDPRIGREDIFKILKDMELWINQLDNASRAVIAIQRDRLNLWKMYVSTLPNGLIEKVITTTALKTLGDYYGWFILQQYCQSFQIRDYNLLEEPLQKYFRKLNFMDDRTFILLMGDFLITAEYDSIVQWYLGSNPQISRPEDTVTTSSLNEKSIGYFKRMINDMRLKCSQANPNPVLIEPIVTHMPCCYSEDLEVVALLKDVEPTAFITKFSSGLASQQQYRMFLSEGYTGALCFFYFLTELTPTVLKEHGNPLIPILLMFTYFYNVSRTGRTKYLALTADQKFNFMLMYSAVIQFLFKFFCHHYKNDRLYYEMLTTEPTEGLRLCSEEIQLLYPLANYINLHYRCSNKQTKYKKSMKDHRNFLSLAVVKDYGCHGHDFLDFVKVFSMNYYLRNRTLYSHPFFQEPIIDIYNPNKGWTIRNVEIDFIVCRYKTNTGDVPFITSIPVNTFTYQELGIQDLTNEHSLFAATTTPDAHFARFVANNVITIDDRNEMQVTLPICFRTDRRNEVISVTIDFLTNVGILHTTNHSIVLSYIVYETLPTTMETFSMFCHNYIYVESRTYPKEFSPDAKRALTIFFILIQTHVLIASIIDIPVVNAKKIILEMLLKFPEKNLPIILLTLIMGPLYVLGEPGHDGLPPIIRQIKQMIGAPP